MDIGSSYSQRGCTRLIPVLIGRGWVCSVFRGWKGILLLGGGVGQAEEYFVRFHGRIHRSPIKGREGGIRVRVGYTLVGFIAPLWKGQWVGGSLYGG